MNRRESSTFGASRIHGVAVAGVMAAIALFSPTANAVHGGGASHEFESGVLPGLGELFEENAPSALDDWLEAQAKNAGPPMNLKELIGFVWKPLVQLGLGNYEAQRQCVSEGMVAGYSLGVAAGLWETEVSYVRNELLVRVHGGGSTLPARCNALKWSFYNAALARGYVEARNVPTKRRRVLRDLLTAHVEEDRSWLPGFTAADGASTAFYQTYANAFQKHLVLKRD